MLVFQLLLSNTRVQKLRRLARLVHPDKCTDARATLAQQQLNEAWAVLGTDRKDDYVRELHEKYCLDEDNERQEAAKARAKKRQDEIKQRKREREEKHAERKAKKVATSKAHVKQKTPAENPEVPTTHIPTTTNQETEAEPAQKHTSTDKPITFAKHKQSVS